MTKKFKKEKANAIKLKGLPILEEDVNFLINEIFINHSDWATKQGEGIKEITFGPDGYGQVCYFITRVDGTKVDISVPYSLRALNKKRMVKGTLRFLIKDQISDFRKEVKRTGERCALSGVVLPDNFHIDHHNPSFNELADTWLEGKNINSLYAETKPHKYYRGVHIFKNLDLTADWQYYHLIEANLQPTTLEANLRKKR